MRDRAAVVGGLLEHRHGDQAGGELAAREHDNVAARDVGGHDVAPEVPHDEPRDFIARVQRQYSSRHMRHSHSCGHGAAVSVAK